MIAINMDYYKYDSNDYQWFNSQEWACYQLDSIGNEDLNQKFKLNETTDKRYKN